MGLVFLAAEFFLILVCLALAFFLAVPLALKTYQRWLKKKNPKDFSSMVILIFVTLYLVLIVAIDLINLIFRYDAVLSYGVNREILDLVMILSVYYFTVPKAVFVFHQWKLTKKNKYFSVMILLSVLTLYALAIIFVTLIPIHIPRMLE